MINLLLASNLRDFAPKLDQVFDRPLSQVNVVCIPTAAFGEDSRDWLEPEKAPLRDRAKNLLSLIYGAKHLNRRNKRLLKQISFMLQGEILIFC